MFNFRCLEALCTSCGSCPSNIWVMSLTYLTSRKTFRWTIKRVLLHGGSQEHACSVICLLSSCATSSFTRGPRSPVTGQLERKYNTWPSLCQVDRVGSTLKSSIISNIITMHIHARLSHLEARRAQWVREAHLPQLGTHQTRTLRRREKPHSSAPLCDKSLWPSAGQLRCTG